MNSTEHGALELHEAEVIKPGSVGEGLSKDMRNGHCRTAHNMSSSSLRKKSDLSLLSKVRCGILRNFMSNLHEIFLGTKLFVLFPAVPLAIAAQNYGFGRDSICFSLLLHSSQGYFFCEGIHALTVGGLLNATCGNATELIIALFALHKGKIEVVKFSLIGSILSNLLLVLGSSLFCGGIANLRKEQYFDRKQANVNTSLLMLGALCHVLLLLFRCAVTTGEQNVAIVPTLALSRVCSIVMLATYMAYLFFQLKTHRQLFESPEEDDDNDDVVSEDETVMGFLSALIWLVGFTIIIAVLSEYVVGTIEQSVGCYVTLPLKTMDLDSFFSLLKKIDNLSTFFSLLEKAKHLEDWTKNPLSLEIFQKPHQGHKRSKGATSTKQLCDPLTQLLPQARAHLLLPLSNRNFLFRSSSLRVLSTFTGSSITLRESSKTYLIIGLQETLKIKLVVYVRKEASMAADGRRTNLTSSESSELRHLQAAMERQIEIDRLHRSRGELVISERLSEKQDKSALVEGKGKQVDAVVQKFSPVQEASSSRMKIFVNRFGNSSAISVPGNKINANSLNSVNKEIHFPIKSPCSTEKFTNTHHCSEDLVGRQY
ncbi:Vacuolar cation/proton exchanger 1a [Dendrobium catenatum]|uniref:Vacuolar cation/proton exchanger 1a n=1 Tax=Dendrobium catenatum TaxID=906689 RepID=A0A2I0VUK7_9ASPA|nr:Vacuolar cation/proton exchanger 1a [Dendrobium catenatum]